MKFIIFSFFALASAYMDINEKYNWTGLLDNKVQLGEYFRCFLDKAPCSDFAAHIKRHLTEITRDGCNECDVTQHHMAHVFTDALRKFYPEYYKEYKEKYDPTGKFFSKYESTIDKF